jgi:hypothetical protein
MEAYGGGNLGRFFNTPEEKAELIRISEEYLEYLAKVKATVWTNIPGISNCTYPPG